MIRITQTLCLAFVAMTFMACHKNRDADSPHDVGDDSRQRDGDNRSDGSRDAEDSLKDAEEELEDTADEVKKETDGDPTTD